MMQVRFKKLRPDARIPAFGHDDSSNAGLDFFLPERCALMPHEHAWLPTGIAWEPVLEDDGYLLYIGQKPALLIRGRSSMAKLGLSVTEGTVDCGYRGEIMIHIHNEMNTSICLEAGERVAQGVTILIPEISVVEVDELGESHRGARGFGSSGR